MPPAIAATVPMIENWNYGEITPQLGQETWQHYQTDEDT
jgi:hypothetical protein